MDLILSGGGFGGDTVTAASFDVGTEIVKQNDLYRYTYQVRQGIGKNEPMFAICTKEEEL